MKWILLSCCFLIFNKALAQQISGIVLIDDATPANAVLVMNMRSQEQIYSDREGRFSLVVSVGDELRFVKKGYDRTQLKITSLDDIKVELKPSFHEIEEVKISPIKLTGNLNRDAVLLSKVDKVEQLQKGIGVPKSPEKPREKVAEVKDVISSLAKGGINIQGIYDIASGDARRKKHLYQLEDHLDLIAWLRKRLDDDYFIELGIPQQRIFEFIEFSILQNPKVKQGIKAQNLSLAMVEMDAVLPIFLSRLGS